MSINVASDRIRERVPKELLVKIWLDPQFYFPHDNKGKLATYSFFPRNILDDFTTTGFQSQAPKAATECLAFQHSLGLGDLVIPTGYFEELPGNYLDQLSSLFVEPFIDAKQELGLTQPLLLTVVASPSNLGLESRVRAAFLGH